MNRSTLKPLVHQIVISATIGIAQARLRNTETRSPVKNSMTY